MATGRIRRAYFWTIKHSFNHLTLAMARRGFGPFALVRHVGRKSGKTFETPILHARTREGFVAVLMYGTEVSWYRNIRAAGRGVIVRGAREFEVDGMERYPTYAGMRAFALPLRMFLKATRRSEFRLLRLAAGAASNRPDADERSTPSVASLLRGLVRRTKRAWLWVLKHTLNPLALWMARRGRAPFSLVRHVGRKSGASYDTPLILARVPGGFITELTYGTGVSWYRNVVAAGGRCIIVWRGREYEIDGVDPYPTDAGRRAFGQPATLLLTVLRRREFRLLHEARATPGAAGPE